MTKRTQHTKPESGEADHKVGSEDYSEFDDEESFEHHARKNSHAKSQRAREARRLIERYREDRDLENRLDEYYFHTDD